MTTLPDAPNPGSPTTRASQPAGVTPPSQGPLGVRLPNWVGDTVLALPALRRLSASGFALQLVGRRWAADLLGGEGWPVYTRPAGWRDAAGQWRSLREQLNAPRGKLPALLMPNSLSSAADAWLGGWRGHGYAAEGRSLLLHRAWPELAGAPHTVARYWHLASRLLDEDRPLPERLGWRVTPAAASAAAAHLDAHGLAARPFVVLCPFGGTVDKQDKSWPHFPALAAAWAPLLAAQGIGLVICPGPGEAEATRAAYPQAAVIDGVGLAAYAALLGRATLVVANDTGPGHLAAAVEAPLISVLGPTDPARWAPWGPTVEVLRRWPGWLECETVLAAARQRLARELAR